LKSPDRDVTSLKNCSELLCPLKLGLSLFFSSLIPTLPSPQHQRLSFILNYEERERETHCCREYNARSVSDWTIPTEKKAVSKYVLKERDF